MRLELEALPHLVNDRLDVDFDERLELVEADNPRPLRPGHQHLHAGRRLSHAIDLGDRAGRVQVRVGRVVDLRVLLGDQQNLLVMVHREADGGDRRPPAHRQRDDQLGKDDVIAQRHQREPPQLKLRRVRVGGLFDCVGHLLDLLPRVGPGGFPGLGRRNAAFQGARPDQPGDLIFIEDFLLEQGGGQGVQL